MDQDPAAVAPKWMTFLDIIGFHFPTVNLLLGGSQPVCTGFIDDDDDGDGNDDRPC